MLMIPLSTLALCSLIMDVLSKNQRLDDQARIAMFAVLSKSRKLHLPFDIQLQLFDSMVNLFCCMVQK